MSNKSGLKPLGSAVLIEPYEPEVRAGRIIIPQGVRAGLQTAEQRATIIEVGPEAWIKEAKPRASTGNKVMVAAYAGTMMVGPLDGKQYRMVNANDIFCQITGELADTLTRADSRRPMNVAEEPVEISNGELTFRDS